MTGRKVDRIFERNDITSEFIAEKYSNFITMDDLDIEWVDEEYERDTGYTGGYNICTNTESLIESFATDLAENKEFMEWFTSLKPITPEIRKAILNDDICPDFYRSDIIGGAVEIIVDKLVEEYNRI